MLSQSVLGVNTGSQIGPVKVNVSDLAVRCFAVTAIWYVPPHQHGCAQLQSLNV